MADVVLVTVNNQDQECRILLDEESEMIAHRKRQVARDELKSAKVEKVSSQKKKAAPVSEADAPEKSGNAEKDEK